MHISKSLILLFWVSVSYQLLKLLSFGITLIIIFLQACKQMFLSLIPASRCSRVLNRWTIIATNWIITIMLNIIRNNRLNALSGRLYLVSRGKISVYRNTIHMILIRNSIKTERLRRFFSFSLSSSTLLKLADSGFSDVSTKSAQNSFTCSLVSWLILPLPSVLASKPRPSSTSLKFLVSVFSMRDLVSLMRVSTTYMKQ